MMLRRNVLRTDKKRDTMPTWFLFCLYLLFLLKLSTTSINWAVSPHRGTMFQLRIVFLLAFFLRPLVVLFLQRFSFFSLLFFPLPSLPVLQNFRRDKKNRTYLDSESGRNQCSSEYRNDNCVRQVSRRFVSECCLVVVVSVSVRVLRSCLLLCLCKRTC